MKTYKFKLYSGVIETIHQTSSMRACVELKRLYGRTPAKFAQLITIDK